MTEIEVLEAHKLRQEIIDLEAAAKQQAATSRHETKMRAMELKEKSLSLRTSELNCAKLVDEEAERVAARSNLSYRFTDVVDAKSTGKCIKQLTLWSDLNPGAPLEVVFTSPGGSVYQGMALFDHIRMLSRRGHQMVTGATGYAASMAGILLQAGDLRWIGEESWVLIHEVSSWNGGTTSDMSDGVTQMKRLQERVIRIFLDRAAGSPWATRELTETQFRAKWKKTDWWLDSAETLAYGFVDEIR